MDYKVMHVLIRCSKAFYHGEIRKQGWSDTECMICSYLYSHLNASQGEIADALAIDKTTISKSITALEKIGYLQRGKANDDRRRNEVQITAAGKQRIEALLKIYTAWLNRACACFSKNELASFESACLKFLQSVQENG